MMMGLCLWALIFACLRLPSIEGRIQEIAGFEIRQEKCLFTPKYGPCKKHFKVFAYDLMTNRCVQFIYSGCGGNPNRFATENECRTHCFVVEVQKAETEDDYDYDTTESIRYDDLLETTMNDEQQHESYQ